MNPRLFTSRGSLFTGRASLFTPGYTPLPRLRRVSEDRKGRMLENATDYRAAERNTVIAD